MVACVTSLNKNLPVWSWFSRMYSFSKKAAGVLTSIQTCVLCHHHRYENIKAFLKKKNDLDFRADYNASFIIAFPGEA